jgi:predicted Zn finger-like uncharacterized protein
VVHDQEYSMIRTADVTSEPVPAVIGDPSAVCPMCHTVAPSTTESALAAGGYWKCGRCGQTWNATRLAVRAAYDLVEARR